MIGNGRPLSPFIKSFFESKAALNARAYNTHLAIILTLRTGATVYIATNDLIVSSVSRQGVSETLDPVWTFNGKIVSAPNISFSQTSSTDGGTPFGISNLDYLLSGLIPETDRLFDGAKLKIYLAFPKPDGTYEGLLYSRGVIKGVEGDREVATVSYVSDVSDKDNTAGGRELTQHCLNELGVNTGKSWCGATGLPPGATCSKVRDDAENGCAFWGQEHAFKAVSFFNPNGLIANYGGSGSGQGFGYGVIGCFDVEMHFRTMDGYKFGHKLKRGDRLLNHKEELGMIESIEIIWAEYRYRIVTRSGAAGIVSASHLFLTGMDDTTGTSAISLLKSPTESAILLKQKELHQAEPDEQQARIIEHVRGRGWLAPFKAQVAPAGYVVKIGMTAPNTYLAGERPGYYLSAHNLKPMYEEI